MRKSTRIALAAAAAGALCAVGITAASASTAHPQPLRPVTRLDAAGQFAPYVDMSNSGVGKLDAAITDHGVKTYTAAFTIGTGCNNVWGDTLPVGSDPNVDPVIAKAKSEGASVIISSGGAGGEPLAFTCTDQGKIDEGYQQEITAYGANSLDFDIEGAAVADTAGVARQMTAIKDLKAKNSGLTVSVTLPVLPDGLTGDGVNVLKAANAAGVKLDNVNVMTMDYGQGTGADMGAAAISAGKATLAQMQSVDPSYTYANLGITPMIGVNDDGSTFSLDNAASVASWAASNGVGRMSYWSVSRDQACTAAAKAPDAAAPSAKAGMAAARSMKPASSPVCSGVSQSPYAFTDTLGKG
ncbi:chitinase [Streptomyces sp. WZ-12]|uniref:chitinase n=1 Tax=Streptomyces sp. WZ-12 TaxID=3030210 RepID=UPI002380F7DF|nr:chitinase [Streptomyces sp. WZ-12]